MLIKRFDGKDSKGRPRTLMVHLDKKRWEFLVCLYSGDRCLGNIRVGYSWLLDAVQPANHSTSEEGGGE